MNIFEVCLTNYCNFKCSYCISDKTRGCDKFSEPLKLNENGDLKIHPNGLSISELEKRAKILKNEGQLALDEYVAKEQANWELTRDEKHDYGDWLNLDSLLSFIRSNLSDDWLINLTGGEPLYYPKVEDFIVELSKTHKVLLTSNISFVRSKPKLLTISRDRIFFRVGYHPEFRNLNTFVECMSYLIENNFKYIVNYVAHPDYYENSEKYKEHIRLLKNNNYIFEVTQFEGLVGDINYPKIRDKWSEIENKLFNLNAKFEPTKSVMGTQFMICEPNGKIFECQGRSSELGNIYENKVNYKLDRHQMCFMTKGCPTLKSANMYLKVFLNSNF